MARLAIEARASNAAPILDQLGLKMLADHVRMVTANDSATALKAGLLSSDWATYQVALAATGNRLHAGDVKLLLEVVLSLPDSFRVSDVLRKLESAELDTNQTSIVRGLYLNSRDQRSRVAAARLLLWKFDDDDVYRDLVSVALQPVKLDGSDTYSPVFNAADAISAYSIATGKRRESTADMIRLLLDRIPVEAHPTYSRKSTLAALLGRLGKTSDLTRLESMIGETSLDLNASAIHAIANLQGQRASELAREQIKGYLEDKPNVSYRWSVDPYCAFIFWKRDQASAHLLIKAIEKNRQSPVVAEAGQPDIEALVEYLQSERIEDRVAAAVRFVKHHPGIRRPWIIDVGKQLVAEGADPKLCEPLLEPGSQKRF